jgi:hypothetical protein
MNANKPDALYRVSNIALDLATMGIFTARYRHGWANAWRADGRLPSRVHSDGAYHQTQFHAASAKEQYQQ